MILVIVKQVGHSVFEKGRVIELLASAYRFLDVLIVGGDMGTPSAIGQS